MRLSFACAAGVSKGDGEIPARQAGGVEKGIWNIEKTIPSLVAVREVHFLQPLSRHVGGPSSCRGKQVFGSTYSRIPACRSACPPQAGQEFGTPQFSDNHLWQKVHRGNIPMGGIKETAPCGRCPVRAISKSHFSCTGEESSIFYKLIFLSARRV